jgi:hypothetical protein
MAPRLIARYALRESLNLAGDADYARQVRARLLPGIWWAWS